ncbi:response regulator [Virgibacillus sediminis]|uniref:Response regulator n=1 Tax=Virgibacillus sediminis TaxID=202260 RepID=A0ABV7A8N3_9BACI
MVDLLLVEDQRLFADGWKGMFHAAGDIQLVGCARDGQEAVNLCAELQPDVVLMDIGRAQMDGVRLTVQIKEQFPDVKVLLLSSEVDEELVISGVNVGADGFLLTELHADVLLETIRNIHRGDNVLSGKAARILTKKIRELTMDKKQLLEKQLDKHGHEFTKRELDIAYLFMDNLSNKQIAKRLYLGEGTVKNYISGIYQKLDIKTRAQAINYFQSLLRK